MQEEKNRGNVGAAIFFLVSLLILMGMILMVACLFDPNRYLAVIGLTLFSISSAIAIREDRR